MTVLYRYSQYQGYDTTAGGSLADFTDGGQVSAYAVTPMQWAVGMKLIQGEPDARLNPLGSTTRAEAAAIFHRFMETIVK